MFKVETYIIFMDVTCTSVVGSRYYSLVVAMGMTVCLRYEITAVVATSGGSTQVFFS